MNDINAERPAPGYTRLSEGRCTDIAHDYLLAADSEDRADAAEMVAAQISLAASAMLAVAQLGMIERRLGQLTFAIEQLTHVQAGTTRGPE